MDENDGIIISNLFCPPKSEPRTSTRKTQSEASVTTNSSHALPTTQTQQPKLQHRSAAAGSVPELLLLDDRVSAVERSCNAQLNALNQMFQGTLESSKDAQQLVTMMGVVVVGLCNQFGCTEVGAWLSDAVCQFGDAKLLQKYTAEVAKQIRMDEKCAIKQEASTQSQGESPTQKLEQDESSSDQESESQLASKPEPNSTALINKDCEDPSLSGDIKYPAWKCTRCGAINTHNSNDNAVCAKCNGSIKLFKGQERWQTQPSQWTNSADVRQTQSEIRGIPSQMPSPNVTQTQPVLQSQASGIFKVGSQAECEPSTESDEDALNTIVFDQEDVIGRTVGDEKNECDEDGDAIIVETRTDHGHNMCGAEVICLSSGDELSQEKKNELGFKANILAIRRGFCAKKSVNVNRNEVRPKLEYATCDRSSPVVKKLKHKASNRKKRKSKVKNDGGSLEINDLFCICIFTLTVTLMLINSN